MTLHEVATQIHNLSLGGFVNGEKMSKAELEGNLKRWLRDAGNNKIQNAVVIEICLPDGRWLATVNKGDYGYDYYIPDTREQEARIVEAITK